MGSFGGSMEHGRSDSRIGGEGEKTQMVLSRLYIKNTLISPVSVIKIKRYYIVSLGGENIFWKI